VQLRRLTIIDRSLIDIAKEETRGPDEPRAFG
jgi:hypothetical protein